MLRNHTNHLNIETNEIFLLVLCVDALTKHMANEWGPQNIRVVGLSPGPIKDTVGYEKLGKHMFIFTCGVHLALADYIFKKFNGIEIILRFSQNCI